MSRSCAALCSAVLASVFVAGCGDDQDPEGAARFWETIQAEDYRSWARAPGYPGLEPSRAAHGDEVEVWVNDVVEAALADPTTETWPVGSVIVKDGYEGGELCFIAGMEKVTPDQWFYVEYDGGGDTLFSGQPEICTGCHAVGDDFVRTFQLP